MSRNAQTITGEPVWYRPDIDGNRKDPDPFRVLLSPLSGREMEAIQREQAIESYRGRADGEGVGEVAASAGKRIVYGVLRRRILNVEGYSLTDVRTGEVTAPTDGEQLVEAILGACPAESEVLDDIYSALQRTSQLKEGLMGNSDGQRHSSPLPMSGAGRLESVTASSTTVVSGGAPTSPTKKPPTTPEKSETVVDAPRPSS